MQSEPTTEQLDEVTVEYRVSPGSNEWLSHVEMIDAVLDWSKKVPLTGAPSITVSKRVTVRGDDAVTRAHQLVDDAVKAIDQDQCSVSFTSGALRAEISGRQPTGSDDPHVPGRDPNAR